MPRRRDAPNGLTAWLITETVSWARDRGHTHVSLNFSPFAGLLAAKADLPRLQRLPLTGGERLGFGQPAGQIVHVTGYPNGAAAPISCLNRAAPFSPTELEFDCDGYTNGTSGSALLAGVDPAPGSARSSA
jgi:hypothetical protein